MPHNILMSKIRCYNPNKSHAALKNLNYIVYIGTRPGVDLTDVKLMSSLLLPKKILHLTNRLPTPNTFITLPNARTVKACLAILNLTTSPKWLTR